MTIHIPAIDISRDSLNQLVVEYQKANDNNLLEQIIRAMVKLCSRLAYRFSPTEAYRDDCFSEALIGVIKAARTYDINDESKSCFSSYAALCASRQIWNFLKVYYFHNPDTKSLDEPLFTNRDGDEMLLKDILVDDTFEIDEGLDPDIEKTINKISAFMDKYFSEKAITLIRNKFGFNSEWPMPDKENAKSLGLSIEEFQSYYQKCLRAIRSFLVLKKHPLWRI